MNIFLTLAILFTNLIAITLVYQFVKKEDKRSQILFIAISFGIIYIAVSIIYAISGIGIDKSVNEEAKNFMIFLFVPVNVIVLIPFIATKYVKYKKRKIGKREFLERVIKISLAGILILTCECIYFRNMKKNIKTINTNIEQTVTDNKDKDSSNDNLNETEKTDTSINTNEIENIQNNSEKTNNVINNNIKTNSI